MRVVVAGQGALGSALLDGAIAAGHEVVAVLVDDRGRGWRRLEGWTDPLRRQARRLEIPTVAVRRAGPRAAARIGPHRPDLLLVGDFGLIVRPELRAVPRLGAVNTHWSLLPRHRGPDPAAAVILAGDEQSGVTFHVLTDEVDRGPILDQASFPVGPRDTAPAIYHRAAALARERVGTLLDRVAAGEAGRAQDEALASWQPRLDRDAARIRWAEPAGRIDRLVRAATWPAAWFPYFGSIVHVRAVEPLRRAIDARPGQVLDRDPLVVATGEGAVRIVGAWTWTVLPAPWPLRSPPVGALLR